MSRPAAKFASAIFVSILAGTAITPALHSETEAADSCLSRPTRAPPEGGHWYYRIDRATKRHCWYLGKEKQKVSRGEPETSQPADGSTPAPINAGTQGSIANARAELPLPQARVEPETSVFDGQRTSAKAVDATSPAIDQRAIAGDAGARGSIVASRWPELAGATSLASPAPPADQAASHPQQAARAAAPPATAVPLPAADAPLARPSGSVQMVLSAILGALALAGLVASGIFKFGGGRWTGWRPIRVDRRAEPDSARTDRPSLSEEARAAMSVREPGLPREPGMADDPNERIAQMLSRLARSAAT